MYALVWRNCAWIFESANDGQVDRIAILGSGSQGSGQDDFLSRSSIDHVGTSQGKLVLRQRARFVRAQDVHAGQLLDCRQPADDGLILGEYPRTDGHGHRKHGRHGHGNGRHSQDQGKLQRFQQRIAAEQGHDENQRYQRHCNHDQKIANFEHGLLKMADRVRNLDQVGRFAKIGCLAGGVDQGVDFPLLDDRAGIDTIARLALDRERFAGYAQTDRLRSDRPPSAWRRHPRCRPTGAG